MKKFVVCLLALFLCAPPVLAEDAPPSAPNPYEEWFTYYYLDKDASKVPDFLAWLQAGGMLEKNPDAQPSLEDFLAVVFEQNPDKAEGWSKAVAFTGKAKEAIDYALKPPVSPKEAQIKTSVGIDRVWGAFSASGDELYLKKLVDVLDKQKMLTGDAKQDDVTRSKAAYTLGANMTEHEAVERFLDRESAGESGAVGDELKQIIANVKKQRESRAFPNRDGDFSAMLFITDPKVAAGELAHASGDVIHFREMAHVKKGEKRTAVIVFAGMQLSPDYQADVTYDIRQIDPQGKTYSDLKDLEGLRQKVPTRFRIFHNKAAIFIAFDSKDKPGVYQVKVLLKDNIGKHSIPMTAKITLRR